MKIATFLSTTESIASDFSPVIMNISKKALLDTVSRLIFNENASLVPIVPLVPMKTLFITTNTNGVYL